MTNLQHRLAKDFHHWLSYALNHPEKQKLDGSPAACIALSVMHKSGDVEREIHGMKLGTKRFDDAGVVALSETLRGVAQTDAQNLSGAQQYVVYAYYEESGQMPGARFILRESGHVLTSPGEISSEPPTAEGFLASRMRKEEGLSQAYMAAIGNLLNHQNQYMHIMTARVVETQKENRDMFAMVKDVMMEMALTSRDHELKVLEYQRNTQLMTQISKFAPAMLNTVTGKEVVPQNTADSMILEALADALDEKTMAQLAPVFTKIPPAAMGVIMSRLEQIVLAKAEREENLQKQLAKMNPDRVAHAELGVGVMGEAAE